MPILSIKALTKYFGGLRAVHDLDLSIEEGQLVGLIGPNGAGKTTVFNMISGVYLPTEGEILFAGRSMIGLKPHQIAQLGIGRTFQNIRLFGNVTVLDNVRTSYHPRAGYGIVDAVLRNRRFSQREKEIRARTRELLAIVGLDKRADEVAKNLPYGDQRRLEIARAMAVEPKLLLLDEPAAGMNPQEVHALMDFIQSIRDEFKLTVLLIEHHMRVVMGICEQITVMDFGEIIARGKPSEVQSDPKVIEAYLGRRAVRKSARAKKPVSYEVAPKDVTGG